MKLAFVIATLFVVAYADVSELKAAAEWKEGYDYPKPEGKQFNEVSVEVKNTETELAAPAVVEDPNNEYLPPCENGGSGTFCCANGAENADCCDNGGVGPFCCTNGAVTEGCELPKLDNEYLPPQQFRRRFRRLRKL